MSAGRFPAALTLVLSYEGGFSDDPRDPGGATNLGVTLAALSDYRGCACSVADVRGLCRADVQPLYRTRYWNAVRGDDLPAGVDLIVFDGAVNQGPEAITRILQRAVGAEPDGHLGPATLSAVVGHGPGDLIEAIRAARVRAYKADPCFARYSAGWLRRVAGVAATGTSWAEKAKAAA